MIYADVIFWTNDINDISIVLPFPPSVGENIEFPIGLLKYTNGAELDVSCFRICNIDWVFKETSMIPNCKFQKLSIFVECP